MTGEQGDNGKSVTIDLLKHMLGDYFASIPVSYLTQTRSSSGSASPELARCADARLVVGQEPSKDAKMQSDKLKELSKHIITTFDMDYIVSLSFANYKEEKHNFIINNKYENLIGVEYQSIIDDINFIRPLIDTSKDDIYKFANYHKIPYLKNSTPEWSQRGKIRNMVLPVLEKWDKRIVDGLFEISSMMKDLHINLKLNVKNDMNEEKDDINMSLLYWKYLIFEKFNFYPSNKSLKSLIERLTIFKNKFSKIDINKKEKIIIKHNLQMNIWKTKSLRISYEFIINK
jgi:tRNA(Ile)-lysidine synthase TilS/MesJ